MGIVSNEYNSLNGKVVLITGGMGGIGSSIVKKFVDSDSVVLVNYHENGVFKDKRAHYIKADLANIEEISSMFKQINEDYGRIDILVNNAGFFFQKPIIATTQMDWDKINSINLRGAFFCSKFAARMMMKKKEGKIINIASTIVDRAIMYQAAYAITKYGMIGLTKSLAKELGGYGINVNGISPGPISTNMNVITDEMEAEILNRMPLGKMIQPEDIANLVAFLSSSKADMITGQIITVDGGLTL